MFSLNTTKQEIFEIVANHLLRQYAKAESPRLNGCPICLYITPSGRKCAIGILFPDGHPAQTRRDDIYNILATFTDLRFLYGAHLELLENLQYIHDKEGVSSWIHELRSFGRRSKLSTTFLLAPNRKKNKLAI